MKNKVSISLFFSVIIIALCLGIVLGLQMKGTEVTEKPDDSFVKNTENVIIHEETPLPVLAKEDKITADTGYMVLKKDVDNGEIYKKLDRIPEKYIGLTREQLIEQLEIYEQNPPLTELEKGFVGIELLSFSPSQVEVQMNYHQEEPTGIFYIMVYDHNIVVMLEDKRTVFLSTQIKLSELPDDVQQDIIKGLFIPNEKSLYDFLENYTS